MAVAFGAAGTPAYSTGPPAPAYPTGITAGQMLVLVVGLKPNSSAIGTPAGWTDMGSRGGGAGSTGIDQGPTAVQVFIKEAAGTETGTVTGAELGSINVAWAQISRWTKASTEAWVIEVLFGADSATGTSWQAFTDNVPSANWITAGDHVMAATVLPTDTNPTWGTESIVPGTSGSITLGAATVVATLASTSGQDIGGRIARFAPSAGSFATGQTLNYTATLSGTTTNASGPTALIRLRAVSAPSAPTSAPSTTIPTPERIDVSWPAVTGATGYTIDYSTDGGSNWLRLATDFNGTASGLNAADPTLPYIWRYAAVNVAGTSAYGPSSAAVSPNPTAPTGVSAAPGPNKATISAAAKNYPTKFKVYRGLAGGARSLVFTSALLGAGTGLSWEDTGVTNGTAYDYHVVTEVQTPTVRSSAASSVVTVTPSNAVTYEPAIGGDDGTAGDFAGYFTNIANSLPIGNHLSNGTLRSFIRFPGVAVAQGATIPSATLRLVVKTTSGNGNDILLTAAKVDADNAGAPSYSAAVFGLSYDNSTRVDFTVVDGSPVGTVINLDVTAAVQAIVDRPGWVSGNAMEFVLVDTGTLIGTVGDLYSYEAGHPNLPSLTVDMTPSAPPEIHTTSGSATGVRSTSAVTQKRAQSTANATGVRSITFTDSKRAITTANATGIRTITRTGTSIRTRTGSTQRTGSITWAVTSTRPTVGNMTTVHSVTSETDSLVPEIHTSTGSATRVGSVTAVTAKRATSAGNAAGIRSVTFTAQKRAQSVASAAAIRSVSVSTATIRTRTGNTQRTGSVTWTTSTVRPKTGSTQRTGSVTATTTTLRALAVSATRVGSITRTGSSTRSTTGNMTSVHTTLSEVIGNGEQHPTTGSATMLHTTLSQSSKRAISAANAAGVRSITATTSKRAQTSANAPGVRTVSATTNTRRTTAANAAGVRSTNAVVSGIRQAVGGSTLSVHAATATDATLRGTSGDAVSVQGATSTNSTTRISQGQTLVVLSTTYTLGMLVTWDTGFDGTAVLDTVTMGTASPVGGEPATAVLVARGAATSVVLGSLKATALIIVPAPATASVEPAQGATAILEPTAASTAAITRE